MSKKLEIELEKAQLIDELLFIENEIQDAWQFSPDNPNMIDIRKELSRLECLKEEIEEKLESFDTEDNG